MDLLVELRVKENRWRKTTGLTKAEAHLLAFSTSLLRWGETALSDGEGVTICGSFVISECSSLPRRLGEHVC